MARSGRWRCSRTRRRPRQSHLPDRPSPDASDLATDLSGVDVAVVAAEMSVYETQLQAAYAAIGNIASLTLSSYLS